MTDDCCYMWMIEEGVFMLHKAYTDSRIDKFCLFLEESSIQWFIMIMIMIISHSHLSEICQY